MVDFPSVEFFEALRDAANAAPDRFRRTGTVDMTLVAKIDYADHSKFYEVVFSGYHCESVREINDVDSPAPGTVVLEGSYETWREMIDNIQSHGQADLRHTLNALSLLDTPMKVTAANQLDTDLFYRYQQNLQEFFDNAADLKTGTHEEGERAGA